MKNKIIVFITGLLIGSIIATTVIYFYTLNNSNNSMPEMQGEPNGTPPDMPNNNQGGGNDN